MKMSEEDLLQVDEPGVGAKQLALRALATVDEQAVAAASDERRRCPAGRRRRGARGAEEHEVEVHGRRS